MIWLGAGSLVGLLSLTRAVQAETVITDGYITDNTVWTAENSPYIIADTVIVPAGLSLTIKPGTSVVGSSMMQGYNIFEIRGSFTLNGNMEKSVSIGGFGGLAVMNGSLNIVNSDISLSDGLGIYDSRAVISSSTITGAKEGISTRSSKISVSGSRIFGNEYGLVNQLSESGGIFQVRGTDEFSGRGGLGNALEDNSSLAYDDTDSSLITITGSAIIGNSEVAIKNDDTVPVQATNNWWGISTGPSYFGQNRIEGAINYSPWLTSDPLVETVQPSCCSSILFLPGLEGTRLYKNESSILTGVGVNRLWEPNRNEDVRKLYLDSNGSSIDPSIYSGEPIDEALGFRDIYGRFMDYLDGLNEQGKINEWKAFGYDWRKPIDEVVAGNQKKATTTETLLEVVQSLAQRSRTGKVTLIAHSNGGLVAKYLVKTLTDLGKENLIDSIISVAVPYLGTPQAVAALLHGYDQSIAGGLIVSKATARQLSLNMPSVYSLLPSKTYFSKILSSTIAFASTTVIGVNDGSYPENISTFEDQSAFISDTGNVRNAPLALNVTSPIEGNMDLMIAADIVHGIIDPFSWPASISKWAIIGWNEATTKGLKYYEKATCGWISCSKTLATEAETTDMGDGTVVTPSAAYNAGQVISLDLEKLSKDENRNIAHANILGASSTKVAITNIINRDLDSDNQAVIDRISKIPGVTIGEPDYSSESSRFVLSTHSPVELHVYDSEGRHTGIIPMPDGLDEEIEDGLYTFYDEEIPGSKFGQFGGNEGDSDSQIYLPDEDGEKYEVVIKGIGFGEFSFDVEKIVNDVTIDKVEFVGLPVNPLTVATTTVWAKSATTSSNSNNLLASTTNILHIDVDGDSQSDIEVKPGAEYDPIIHLEALKKTISNLIGNNPRSKALIKRIDKIEDLIKKGELKKAQTVAGRLDKRFDHLKLKGLTEAEKKEIVDMIDLFIGQFE